MKILKTILCAALLVAGLCGCEKIDVNKLEGTWTEQYDPTVFAMDGSVEYTFDGNNGYQLHVYDALSGESHDYSGHYAIDLINKGTITITATMPSTLLTRVPLPSIRRCLTTAMSPTSL